MSRTVGPNGPAHKDKDLYETPEWCIMALLEKEWPYPKAIAGAFLEPCAGSGNILRAVRKYFKEPRNYCRSMTAIEIEKSHIAKLRSALSCDDEVFHADYLQLPPPAVPYDLCIMNPPYGHRKDLAVQFIQKACLETRKVWALLRLNWIRPAKTRREWLLSHMPQKIYVLPRRPSFTGGDTDMCEYAWMLFTSFNNYSSVLEVINVAQQ